MTGFEIGMGGGWLMHLALFGSVFAVVWFLVTLSRGEQDRAIADPKAIVAERYARGDFDATEHERARRLLSN